MEHTAVDRYNGDQRSERVAKKLSSLALNKLRYELRTLPDDLPEGISATLKDNDDYSLWTAEISGLDNSPWQNGVFKLSLRFPHDYPFKPPDVRFVSPMFHPNIGDDGVIYVDLLRELWSPSYTVAAVLISIQSFLCDPNPDSPINVDAARLFKIDKDEYNQRVREMIKIMELDGC